MNMFDKQLIAKVLSLCVSVCLLSSVTAYSLPTLRTNSMFDKIKEASDKDRTEDAKRRIGAEDEVKLNKIADVDVNLLLRIEKGSVEEETLGVDYSYLKLGRPREVKKYSRLLTQAIRGDIGATLAKDHNDWVIVNIGGFGIPNAGYLLSRNVAEELGLPHLVLETGLKTDRALVQQYASFARKEEREIVLYQNFAAEEITFLKGKKIIFIDDGLITGTILKQGILLLDRSGVSQVEVYVLALLEAFGDFSFENRINRKAIERDRLTPLVEVLNDESSIYTTKLVYYAFELDSTNFKLLLSQLSPIAKLNLYLYAVEYFAYNSPDNLDILSEALEEDIGLDFPSSKMFRGIALEEFFKQMGGVLKDYNYKVPLSDAQKMLQIMEDLLMKAYRNQFPVRTILYDLNGTLEFSDSFHEAMNEATRDAITSYLNIPEQKVRKRINELRVRLRAQALPLRQHDIAKEFGIPWSKLDEEITKLLDPKDYITADIELRQMLESQKLSGCSLGAVSDGTNKQTRTVLVALGVSDLFDEVITADVVGCTKEDPAFYEKALGYFPVRPNQIVMIGDRVELDVLPALSVNMHALRVDSRDDLLAISKSISQLDSEPKDSLEMQILEQKFQGALLGTFVGDALGMPVERKGYMQIKSTFGTVAQMIEGCDRKLSVTHAPITLPKGHGTDESILMIAIAESIVEEKKVSAKALIRKCADYYDPRFGFSSRTGRFLTAIKKGIPWEELAKAEKESSMSNGATSRIVPVALMHYDNFDVLEEKLLESITVTHRHPLAIVGSLLQGFAIANAIKARPEASFNPVEFVDQLIEYVQGWEDAYFTQDGVAKFKYVYSKKLQVLRSFLKQKNIETEEVIDKLGNGFTTQDSVVTAIYAFLRHPYSFRDAVIYGVNLGGDADSIGAMAGAISGAFLGSSAIPKGWLDELHPFELEGIKKGKEDIYVIAHQLIQLKIENFSPIDAANSFSYIKLRLMQMKEQTVLQEKM